jgi:hypothetical protein
VNWEAIFVDPFFFFIRWPLAALVPAAAFALGFLWRRKPSIAVAAALWAVYAVWELSIKLGVSCPTSGCTRIDLVLAIPLLWLASLVAAMKMCTKKAPRSAA